MIFCGMEKGAKNKAHRKEGPVVPLKRFELPTLSLRMTCSTPELQRPNSGRPYT